MVRIAVVTPLFPIPEEPFRGQPIYFTVKELQRHAEVAVFCPVAAYPGWARPSSFTYYESVDEGYSPPGVRASYLKYPAFPLLSRPLNAVLSTRALLAPAREFQPDLILAYWIHPGGSAAVSIGARLGVPVVVGARGSDLRRPPDWMTRRTVQRTLRSADFVVTVSNELRERAIALGVAADRVRAIPNGCDTTVFFPGERREACAEIGADPDGQLILFVGHLIAAKGVLDLVEAFTRLAPSRPRLRLSFVGDGGLRAELEARLRRAGLSERALFPGTVPAHRVASWMRAADVFCLPSHSEGCPNVVIEALACGTPVVATEVGGTPDLLSPAAGRLVQPGRPEALASALAAALEESGPGRRERIPRFRRSWAEVADETFEICMGVIERRL